jgi:uncharacterized protein (TIGR00369 family)
MQHAAKTPEDLLPLDRVREMSGIEFLRAVAEGRLAGPPIAGVLNFRLKEIAEGRVVFSGRPEFAAMNPIGTVHGGWYGTILDSCMACAVQSLLPRGVLYTTLEYKVNILRPVPPGTEVHAIGEAQHVGRSTGVARGEVRGAENGRLYATGSTTCIVIGG